MKRISSKQSIRTLLVAVAAVAGLGGLAPEAKALQFNSGDLVLSVMGDLSSDSSQQYYRNLGPVASYLSPGAQISINLNNSLLNPMAAVGNPALVQWTLVSGQGTTQLSIQTNLASVFDTAQTLANQSNNGVASARNSLTSWNGALAPTGAGTEIILSASSPSSFTTVLGISGSLSGTWIGGGMQGSLGNLMTIINGRALVSGVPNVLSDVGRAVLTADGILTICGGAGCTPAPVPLPAAVVLFGSGLIGLIGIARRRFS